MATVLAVRCRVAPNRSCSVVFSPAPSFLTAAAAGLLTGLEKMLEAAVPLLLAEALLCARSCRAEGAEVDRCVPVALAVACRILRAWCLSRLLVRSREDVRTSYSWTLQRLSGLRREVTGVFWLTCVWWRELALSWLACRGLLLLKDDLNAS